MFRNILLFGFSSADFSSAVLWFILRNYDAKIHRQGYPPMVKKILMKIYVTNNNVKNDSFVLNFIFNLKEKKRKTGVEKKFQL